MDVEHAHSALPYGGSACISQSSAWPMTVPMMKLTWGRMGYLASVVFSAFQHVHGIAEFPIPPAECRSASVSRIGMGDRCGMRRVMKTVTSWRSALTSGAMHFVACHRWHKSHRGHRCWSVPSPSRCFATPTLRVRRQSRLPPRVINVVSRVRLSLPVWGQKATSTCLHE